MKAHIKLDKIPYQIVAIFSILAIGIGIAGHLYNKNQKEQAKKDMQNGLYAIANLKANQILNWRRERIEDAEIICKSRIIASRVREFLKSPETPALRQEILSWIESLRGITYKNILLLDTKGVVRLSTSTEDEKIGDYTEKLLEEALGENKIVFSDFHKNTNVSYIHLDMVAPLIGSQGGDNIPVGALLLRIDPNKFLYPLIQLWPTPSPTAETLLVQREGDKVLYLNELRHRKNTALSLSIPLSKKTLPAAMAVLGKEGIVEGVDYRGVPVIGALRAIPGTSWFLIAKVDAEEIYGPIRERTRLVYIIVGILILSAGLSIGLWWRQKISEVLKQDIMERIQMEDRLKESLKEKEMLLKEIHHRVKNNLQIISSMLQLQSDYIKDEQTLITFRESQNRVDTMALIHEKLYHSRDIAKINFAEYIEELTANLLLTYGIDPKLIRLGMNISEAFFDVNTSIPCGLIINELVSNSLKHAFPKGRKGEINITFQPAGGDKYILVVSDNGAGLPEDIDFRDIKTLGLKLVTSLVNQLDGDIELIRDKGTTFKITFGELKYKERV